MLLQEAHIGPQGLPEGVTFSTSIADRIWSETNVRVNHRHRPKWGAGKKVTYVGPADKIADAIALLEKYGRDPEMIEEAQRYKGLSEAEK